MIFHAELDEPAHKPGPESLDTRLFSADQIPWDELAFQTVRQTLGHWITDSQKGSYPLHEINIHAPEGARV